MDTDTQMFPLLQLPVRAKLRALKIMNGIQKINLSLCSKKSKKLVKSLDHKAIEIAIYISANVNLNIKLEKGFGNLSMCMSLPEEIRRLLRNRRNRKEPIQLRTLNSVEIDGRFANRNNENGRWTREGFTVRDWLNHFMEIFNYSKIDILFQHPCDYFGIDSIKEMFQGLNIVSLGIYDRYSDAHAQVILEAFGIVKQLGLLSNPFQNFNELLIQNFDFIEFGIEFPITLNELLLVNSKSIEAKDARDSPKRN